MADTNGRNGKNGKAEAPELPGPKKGMSEQSKFTPERCAIIIKASGQGLSKELCAASAGINYSTLRRWEMRGEEDPDGPVHDFVVAWHKAESKFIQAHLANISRHAIGNVEHDIKSTWMASAWLVERRHPDQYGRRIVEVGGHNGKPIEIEVSDARERLLENIAGQLEPSNGREED